MERIDKFAHVEGERAKLRPADGQHPLSVQLGPRRLKALEAEIALRVCERVAQGELVRDICAEGGIWPTEVEFMRWALQYPEVSRALSAAKALSSFSLEEEAVAMARSLKNAVTFLPAKTTAYRTAMEQLRWSAERRNPAQFSAKAPVAVTVPIQINTSLNLENAEDPQEQNVFHLEAKVMEEEPPDELSTFPDAPSLATPRPKQAIKHDAPPQLKDGARSASFYKLPKKEREDYWDKKLGLVPEEDDK